MGRQSRQASCGVVCGRMHPEDAVTRRAAQRRRNARAIDKAVIECERSRKVLPLADVVAGSIANPEVRRAELMVRIRGCIARAADVGAVAEFLDPDGTIRLSRSENHRCHVRTQWRL